MAGIAGYLLLSQRVDTGTRKIRVDLPNQQDHFSCDVFARIDVELLRLSAAVAVVAIHVEGVVELAHDSVRSMDMRVERQHLQTDTRGARSVGTQRDAGSRDTVLDCR